MDQYDAAIRLFRLNIRLHPESWNTHDSLGEALGLAGRIPEAITSYERSIQINPSITSRNALRQLRKRIHKKE